LLTPAMRRSRYVMRSDSQSLEMLADHQWQEWVESGHKVATIDSSA